jgi:hypothetical protein
MRPAPSSAALLLVRCTILGTGMVSVRRDGDDLAVQLSDGRQLRPGVLRAMRPPSRAHRI